MCIQSDQKFPERTAIYKSQQCSLIGTRPNDEEDRRFCLRPNLGQTDGLQHWFLQFEESTFKASNQRVYEHWYIYRVPTVDFGDDH